MLTRYDNWSVFNDANQGTGATSTDEAMMGGEHPQVDGSYWKPPRHIGIARQSQLHLLGFHLWISLQDDAEPIQSHWHVFGFHRCQELHFWTDGHSHWQVDGFQVIIAMQIPAVGHWQEQVCWLKTKLPGQVLTAQSHEQVFSFHVVAGAQRVGLHLQEQLLGSQNWLFPQFWNDGQIHWQLLESHFLGAVQAAMPLHSHLHVFEFHVFPPTQGVGAGHSHLQVLSFQLPNWQGAKGRHLGTHLQLASSNHSFPLQLAAVRVHVDSHLHVWGLRVVPEGQHLFLHSHPHIFGLKKATLPSHLGTMLHLQLQVG